MFLPPHGPDLFLTVTKSLVDISWSAHGLSAHEAIAMQALEGRVRLLGERLQEAFKNHKAFDPTLNMIFDVENAQISQRWGANDKIRTAVQPALEGIEKRIEILSAPAEGRWWGMGIHKPTFQAPSELDAVRLYCALQGNFIPESLAEAFAKGVVAREAFRVEQSLPKGMYKNVTGLLALLDDIEDYGKDLEHALRHYDSDLLPQIDLRTVFEEAGDKYTPDLASVTREVRELEDLDPVSNEYLQALEFACSLFMMELLDSPGLVGTGTKVSIDITGLTQRVELSLEIEASSGFSIRGCSPNQFKKALADRMALLNGLDQAQDIYIVKRLGVSAATPQQAQTAYAALSNNALGKGLAQEVFKCPTLRSLS